MSIQPYSDTDLTFRLQGVKADLVEVCLRGCQHISVDALRSLKQPLLLTPNTHDIERIKELLTCKPFMLDIPHPCPEGLIEKIQEISPDTKVILSYHNHESTPDMDSIFQQMQVTPADYYKLATYAKDGLDTLRVMAFQKKSADHVVALAMGEGGIASRVAAPILGAPLMWSALEEGAQTAPGQLSVSEMRQIYHYDQLTKNTALCGLFGNPVTASPGYLVHNAVYRNSGIDALYVSFRIEKEQLKEAVGLAEELGFLGLSITSPHKEAILQHLDRVDCDAQEMGSVNTVTFVRSEKGCCIREGRNTDAISAVEAIEESVHLRDKKMAVLGSGGAARSLVVQAKKAGAVVQCYARSSRGLQVLPLESLAPDDYDILVNATSSQMPVEDRQIRSGSTVMDMHTSPYMTPLLDVAKAKGCCLIHGWQMYTRQAARQIDLWFVEK